VPLYAIAIFLSAALLFLVQPLSGKVLLPLLGGSPAVWNTCMVFYQAVLLLGYFYSHLSTRYLKPKAQALVHIGLLVIAGATLPIPINVGDPGAGDPVIWLLRTLALSVGLPFFVVSTTGPLLQRWFSTTDHPAAKDPYFLYAASNAGSIIGLLAYPALLEPFLARMQQSWVWTAGYAALAPLVGACAWVMFRHHAADRTARADRKDEASPALAVSPAGSRWKQRAFWLVLAFVPSSLMLGVTQYITTDVAPIPLLWIIPLLLYLLSFIVAFSGKARLSAAAWGRMMPISLAAVLLAVLMFASNPLWLLASLHLLFFFITAMMCHKRMAEDRPDTSRLTEFYLIMSLGGVLGGIFNALISPTIFNNLLEYPIVIGLACLMRPQVIKEGKGRGLIIHYGVAAICALVMLAVLLNIDAALARGVLKRFNASFAGLEMAGGALKHGKEILVSNQTMSTIARAGVPTLLCLLLLFRAGSARFALTAMFLLIGSTWLGEGGIVLRQVRTFFGVNRVYLMPERTWVKLAHGTTVHGLQARLPDSRGVLTPPPLLTGPERHTLLFKTNRTDEWLKTPPHTTYLPLIPTTYYHPSGPIGNIFGMLTAANRLDKVALVGLGGGTLAAYAQPNTTFIFYEIDRAVIDIAFPQKTYGDNFFSFIADAVRDKSVTIGAEEGDARLRLRDTQQGPFDLIVLDAFSSDAIPVHLLTREAIEIYLTKLKPDGILAFHISNRYFDIRSPLKRIAHELKLKALIRNDSFISSQQAAEGKRESLWLVMVRDYEAMGKLANLPSWERDPEETTFPVWTDDHANVLRALVKK